jgi:hypothetical protein
MRQSYTPYEKEDLTGLVEVEVGDMVVVVVVVVLCGPPVSPDKVELVELMEVEHEVEVARAAEESSELGITLGEVVAVMLRQMRMGT